MQYSYDNRSVWIVNSTLNDARDLTVTSTLYDFDLQQRDSQTKTVSIGPDGTTNVLTVPDTGATGTTFLSLKLADASGKVVSQNFYTVPPRLADLDWAKTNGYITPAVKYEDMTDLVRLPAATLAVSTQQSVQSGEHTVSVTLKNTGHSLALAVRLRVTEGKTDNEILPVFWDDNYISLLPGEERTIAARFSTANPAGAVPIVQVDGWSVQNIVREMHANVEQKRARQ